MYKLSRKNTALVVIDMQEKLADVMDEDMFDTALHNTAILTESFRIMGLPVIETRQYPKGLGNTVEDLRDSLEPRLIIEKTAFSACADQRFVGFLKENALENIILTGMEAHICVLQTALDLIEAGFNVHIAADAVISRNDFNWEMGLDIMQNAGAVVSVAETIIYQLIGDSSVKEFKEIQRLMK